MCFCLTWVIGEFKLKGIKSETPGWSMAGTPGASIFFNFHSRGAMGFLLANGEVKGFQMCWQDEKLSIDFIFKAAHPRRVFCVGGLFYV